jgi:hypothetical protein
MQIEGRHRSLLLTGRRRRSSAMFCILPAIRRAVFRPGPSSGRTVLALHVGDVESRCRLREDAGALCFVAGGDAHL